jgi:hypothetical protein
MRLEDPTRGVVYLAVSKDWLNGWLDKWSDPVQVMVEHVPDNVRGDDLTLVFREVAVRFEEVA